MVPTDIVKLQQKANDEMMRMIQMVYPEGTLIRFKKGSQFHEAIVKPLNFETNRLLIEDTSTKATYMFEVDPYAPPEKISGPIFDSYDG